MPDTEMSHFSTSESELVSSASKSTVEVESSSSNPLSKRDHFLEQRVSSISAPTSQRAVNHLVANCILPGVGTLLHGRTALGIAQVSVVLLGISLSTYSILASLGVVAIAYMWSIWTGISFTKEKELDPLWDS